MIYYMLFISCIEHNLRTARLNALSDEETKDFEPRILRPKKGGNLPKGITKNRNTRI